MGTSTDSPTASTNELRSSTERTAITMSRELNAHHDGHALTASIELIADEPGPGGASHRYDATIGGEPVAMIQFQKGPRNVEGSAAGVVESVLRAIVADRMRAFNEGDYRCRENALVLTKVEEAMHWLKHRADERAKRGVLGTYSK